jgi:hypothetical protein
MTFSNQKLSFWTPEYWNHIQRNIGVITFQEQELIRTSQIAVLGVGGLGGPLAENLVRAGCQNLVICDFDKFDETNLNRQICTLEDMGKYKVDVLEKYLMKIDPNLTVRKYIHITKDNISDVLYGVKVVALTLDDPITSILIARVCREQKIPMIESWAIPMLYSMWFTPESIDYESFYNLRTHHLSFSGLMAQKSEIEMKAYNSLIPKVLNMPYVREKYQRDPEAFEAMVRGDIGLRSFAPVVRITADFLSLEILFSGVLKIKPMILAPKLKGFDYIRMELYQ